MNFMYENFAHFFEQPTRNGLRDLLKLNYGEHDFLDFKCEWPNLSKVAKHILAFANSGGGCIVFGVYQHKTGELESKGLESLIDKANIYNGVKPFLPEEVSYDVLDFTFNESEYEKIKGKKFQVLFIENKPEYIPYISVAEGDGIRSSTVYVRRGTNSLIASYEELQRLINKRIETRYSSNSEMDLEAHLTQLKILYKNIQRYKIEGNLVASMALAVGQTLGGQRVPNEIFPEEDFEQFIARMISKKKERIAKILDI